MIVLTILHSQIVATYGSKIDDSRNRGVRSKSGYKQRRNSLTGSGSQGKVRSKRRTSRYSHRRRSNVKVAASASINTASPFHREGSQEGGCYSSPASRRVFFKDVNESKSWTSSNSDKDEGIVDEMLSHENPESGETDPFEGCSNSRRRLSGEVQNIVEKNIIEANLTATIKKFAEEESLAIRQQNEFSIPTKEDIENCTQPSTPANENFLPEPTFSLRSNLRKRNPSKVSEISTSCADCSSNNESSTEEEYREATSMEDEEMRSKSEWTAVTTNSGKFSLIDNTYVTI